MGILDDDIRRVRDASDIVGIISEHVQLKRSGTRWTGLCPFHSEKSPSFSVNQEQGLYLCFGCQASGDVITFVREMEHLDFVGAVEWLGQRAGIQIRYTDEHQGESRKRRAKLVDAVRRAVDFYHQRLLSSGDAGQARGYLRERGLDGDIVRRYQIGWAPDAWDTLAKALQVPNDVWTDAGLGFLNSRNRQTDAFRGRILFPIYDVQGEPVGFGGRIMPGAEGPKYKNSAESPVYAKSKLLYGLHWAKGDIVKADEAIVCEGYTDVIGFDQAGVGRAVATCGTALTEDHVKVLRSFARRVVLAFDADAAGQKAADRFFGWERQYDVDVAVAAMPGGVDPADLARTDPDALRAAVEGAVPFLQFRVNRVLGGMPMQSPEQRARAAEAALAVISEHPSDLVRDQYVMDVASRTAIDPERLRRLLQQGGLRAAPAPDQRGSGRERDRHDDGADSDGGRPPPVRVRRDGPEPEALQLLVDRRDDIDPWLHEVLFADPPARRAYVFVQRYPDVRSAIDAAGEQDDRAAAAALLHAVASQSDAEPLDVVARLLQEAVRRTLFEFEAKTRRDDDLSHAREAAWLKLRLEELGDVQRRVEAAEQLLAWLVQRFGNDPDGTEGTG